MKHKTIFTIVALASALATGTYAQAQSEQESAPAAKATQAAPTAGITLNLVEGEPMNDGNGLASGWSGPGTDLPPGVTADTVPNPSLQGTLSAMTSTGAPGPAREPNSFIDHSLIQTMTGDESHESTRGPENNDVDLFINKGSGQDSAQ